MKHIEESRIPMSTVLEKKYVETVGVTKEPQENEEVLCLDRQFQNLLCENILLVRVDRLDRNWKCVIRFF